MNIERLRLVNFKGIAERELIFNDKVTVIIGDNGSGKSAILDALSICLGTILSRTGASFGFNGRKTRPLLPNEVRKVMLSSENIEFTKVTLAGSLYYSGERITWSRSQDTTSKSLSYRDARGLSDLGRQMAEKLHSDIDLPLISYHSTSRLASEMNTKRKPTPYEKIGSKLDGYYACLDPKTIRPRFISWFKTFEDAALKFNKDKTLYEAFTRGISSMVPGWTDIKFHWGLDDLVGKQSDGTWIPLSDLSDGYRSVVRLTADLAYRAIKLNPHLGSDVLKSVRGIVLIDEIDMHIHPKWQRTIIKSLTSTFPNVQFIATTHSPFIVQSLKAEEVINLDENRLTEDPNTMSLEMNALFMGVQSNRSDEFESKTKIAHTILSNEMESNGDHFEDLIDDTDDPAFKAKLQLELLAKKIKNEGR